MNQIYAYLFLLSAGLIAIIPIYKYLYAKYYYVDTTPIRYWLNKKQTIKKRYKTFKANRRNRNTKISKLNNRNKSQLSYSKYGKLNRHSIKY